MGRVRDFVGGLIGISRFSIKSGKKGFSALFHSWESFFTRRLYRRLQDCWGRPISSSPGAMIQVMSRKLKPNGFTLEVDGQATECINLGSYNYLGFADDWKTSCRDEVMKELPNFPISMCSSRMDIGNNRLHEELEHLVARFLNKEAAVVYGMGYDTNTATIPALMGAESLIVSDSMNHTSIVNGARNSSSSIRIFRHNDPEHLDEVLREAIVRGQPKHHRPWKKILVMVEGIYSMEGDICRLPEIVKVCKKNKCYIYVDEAHSVGALGKTGRGVCEHTGVDTRDIDILMGTFTKSFSGMGGYIAASAEIVRFLKANASGLLYHNSMSPVICQQVITAFRVIMGEDGSGIGAAKITALRENSNYFRSEMKRIGLHVVGDADSPIIPVMIYLPGKICEFSRQCLNRGLAVVVVGFPAVPILLSRSRFCISAGHTRAEIERAVKIIEEVAEVVNLRYESHFFG
jgi:serine palmitoyltransferase